MRHIKHTLLFAVLFLSVYIVRAQNICDSVAKRSAVKHPDDIIPVYQMKKIYLKDSLYNRIATKMNQSLTQETDENFVSKLILKSIHYAPPGLQEEVNPQIIRQDMDGKIVTVFYSVIYEYQQTVPVQIKVDYDTLGRALDVAELSILYYLGNKNMLSCEKVRDIARKDSISPIHNVGFITLAFSFKFKGFVWQVSERNSHSNSLALKVIDAFDGRILLRDTMRVHTIPAGPVIPVKISQ